MSRKDDGPRWSQGKVDKSTSLDGAMDSMAGGRDRWYSFQGRADDLKIWGTSPQHFVVNNGGTEELTGTSGGGVDGLTDFGRGGGRGLNLKDTGDFQLGGTSGDTWDFVLSDITEANSTSPSVVGVWAGPSSIPSNSTSNPIPMVNADPLFLFTNIHFTDEWFHTEESHLTDKHIQ